VAKPIEFEAEIRGQAETSGEAVWFHTYVTVPGNMVEAGKRYRVTLEPIEPELKPCPFCEDGGDPRYWKHQGAVNDCGESYCVRCWACRARTDSAETKERAAELWNRRAWWCHHRPGNATE